MLRRWYEYFVDNTSAAALRLWLWGANVAVLALIIWFLFGCQHSSESDLWRAVKHIEGQRK